jgi:hypothetical protein
MSNVGVRGVLSHHSMGVEVIGDFSYGVFHQVYPIIPLLVEFWDNEIFEFVLEIG